MMHLLSGCVLSDSSVTKKNDAQEVNQTDDGLDTSEEGLRTTRTSTALTSTVEPLKEFGVHSALEFGAEFGLAKHVDLNKALGAKLSRIGLNWYQMETTKGVYNWNNNADKAITALLAQGIKPMVIIGMTSPAWANGCPNPQDLYNCGKYVPTNSTQFYAWVNHYIVFVKAVMQKYRGKAIYWELGNEVNIDDFWLPAPNTYQYAYWSYHIYKAMKSIDPNAIIALGGGLAVQEMAYVPVRQIGGIDFLRQTYGHWKNIDPNFKPKYISMHAYSWTHGAIDIPGIIDGKNVFLDVELIRNVLKEVGTGQEDIWITEFGWQLCNDQNRAIRNCRGNITEAQKTLYLQQAINHIIYRWNYVTKIIWFWDIDRRDEQFQGYGLINSSLVTTPSGNAFKAFTSKNYTTSLPTTSNPPVPQLTSAGFGGTGIWVAGNNLIKGGSCLDIYLTGSSTLLKRSCHPELQFPVTQDQYKNYYLYLPLSTTDLGKIQSYGAQLRVINFGVFSNFVYINPPAMPKITRIGIGCTAGNCIWMNVDNFIASGTCFNVLKGADKTTLLGRYCPATAQFQLTVAQHNELRQSGLWIQAVNGGQASKKVLIKAGDAAFYPFACACRTDKANFCHYPMGTANCHMVARGGYCDPNKNGWADDADWVRGYNEYQEYCK